MSQVQRVAAYAVVIRDSQILLSRLAPRVSRAELWTLPGGGLDHGEDPRDAVVREVREETGLEVTIGERARTFSLHLPDTWRRGRRVDAHSLRIVYDGWVPSDSPSPRVVEIDGSTVDAAWLPLDDVLDGTVPTVSLVGEAISGYRPVPYQRIGAYALIRRSGTTGEEVLLTRISARGFHTGQWALPGGGVEHGEHPTATVVREVAEETGLTCTVGRLLTADDVVVHGTAPSGRDEEFHSVGLVYEAALEQPDAPPVIEADGTTDAVQWWPLADVGSGAVTVVDLVRTVLAELKELEATERSGETTSGRGQI